MAKDFVFAQANKAGDGSNNLRVRSAGGDTFDSLTICNALKSRETPVVTVTADGMAASLIAVAAMDLRI